MREEAGLLDAQVNTHAGVPMMLENLPGIFCKYQEVIL